MNKKLFSISFIALLVAWIISVALLIDSSLCGVDDRLHRVLTIGFMSAIIILGYIQRYYEKKCK